MDEIKLYLAGAYGGGVKGEKILADLGVRHRLCSYAYPEQLRTWFEAVEYLPEGDRGSIMLDSGAFTAWNKGKEIDLSEYIKHVHEQKERAEKLGVDFFPINLDVIPKRSEGKRKSVIDDIYNEERTEIIENAAAEGFKNLKRMIRNGIKPIHVFHRGESWKWLDKAIENTDYIGISPTGTKSAVARRSWIESVFEYLDKHNAKVRTHGFGVHSHPLLVSFPWTSCDATSWRLSAAMGFVFIPEGGFDRPNFSTHPIKLNVSERTVAIGIGKLSQRVLNSITKLGYRIEDLQVDWRPRVHVNVIYMLRLQEAINKERANLEFKPRTKFF